PFFPFMLLAVGVGAAALTVHRQKQAAAAREAAEEAAPAKAEDEPAAMLAMDDLRIELGYGLLPLISEDDATGKRLPDQIRAVRRAIAQELGFVTPAVRILDNMSLGANDYVIRLKEQDVARGSLRPGFFLVMNPTGGAVSLVGEMTKDPAFGLDAMWIDAGQKDEAGLKGYTVVDAATVLTTHLTEIIKSEAPDLLSYAETKKLIDALPDKHRNLVSDLIPNVATVTTVQRVLQTLIAERISIRDLPSILEAVAEAAPTLKTAGAITEHVRARLSRQICGDLKSADGSVPIVTLSADWDAAFSENIIGQGDDRQLALAPSRLQEFVAEALKMLEEAASAGHAAAIVASPGVRPFVRSVMERVRPQTPVLSQNEIHPHARLLNLGRI
ncbi:MAG: FHIPEP family type III secretion protein, partial [Pseudomonadota bacterium]